MVRSSNSKRSRAVLIGAGSYDNAQLPDLPAAARNVAALGGLLAVDGWTQVVDPLDVAAVLDPLRTASLQAEELLVVYYAGHGLLLGRRRDELHLAVGRSDLEKPWTAVPYAQVADLVRDSVATVKVVILDCCYSGRATSVPLMTAGPGVMEQVDVEGVYVMTSSPATRPSYAPSGSAFTAFTGALLDELAAAADGTDGQVGGSSHGAATVAGSGRCRAGCPE